MRRWLLALIPATIFLFGPLVLRIPFHHDCIFSHYVDSRLSMIMKRSLCSIKKKSKVLPGLLYKEALPAQ